MADKTSVITLGLLFALGGICAAAQAEVLSLQKALEMAQANSQKLAAAAARADARRQAIRWSGAPEEPMISIEASNYALDDLSSQSTEMTGNMLKLSQRLPFPGKRRLRAEAAAHKASASLHSLAEAGSMLRRDVRRAYYEAAYLQGKRDLTRKDLRLTKEKENLLKAAYESGKASQVDYLMMQAESLRRSEELLGVEAELTGALEELEYFTGEGSGAVLMKLPGGECSERLNEETVLQEILASSPLLKELGEQLQASRSEIELASLGSSPDLELMLSYMRRDGAMTENGRDLVSAGVGFSLPIWQEDRQEARLSAARSREAEKRAALENEVRMLRAVFTKTASAKRRSAERLSLLGHGRLPLLSAAERAAESEYHSGSGKIEDFLKRTSERLEAEIEFQRILAECLSAGAEISYLKGE